jgi:hypothetical protein
VILRLLGCIALIFAALVAAPVAKSEPGTYSSQDETFHAYGPPACLGLIGGVANAAALDAFTERST